MNSKKIFLLFLNSLVAMGTIVSVISCEEADRQVIESITMDAIITIEPDIVKVGDEILLTLDNVKFDKDLDERYYPVVHYLIDGNEIAVSIENEEPFAAKYIVTGLATGKHIVTIMAESPDDKRIFEVNLGGRGEVDVIEEVIPEESFKLVKTVDCTGDVGDNVSRLNFDYDSFRRLSKVVVESSLCNDETYTYTYGDNGIVEVSHRYKGEYQYHTEKYVYYFDNSRLSRIETQDADGSNVITYVYPEGSNKPSKCVLNDSYYYSMYWENDIDLSKAGDFGGEDGVYEYFTYTSTGIKDKLNIDLIDYVDGRYLLDCGFLDKQVIKNLSSTNLRLKTEFDDGIDITNWHYTFDGDGYVSSITGKYEDGSTRFTMQIGYASYGFSTSSVKD